LNEARRWIGTPYRHQASLIGAGCDCLGLVRGVWRALYGEEPEAAPPYAPDWAGRGGGEMLLNAARRWLAPVAHAVPGDVLVFRYAPDAPVRHCAILSGGAHMIHAVEGRAVCESALVPWWHRRIAGVFAFPEI
jgi:NlpC/P60 family putative phage cell wall peptidase